jgi:methylmalonyl-CoA/ethylmalonyl-CoA epimerase
MKFHHVGIACKNIDEEIANISKIHQVIEQSQKVFDKEQNAELVLLTLADGTKLELISGKQVENLVRKHITYYHLCFEVDDIRTDVDRLVNEGAFLISAPKSAVLFNNREVAFLNVSYGMIELLNSK